jgi:hypothetical protein
MRVKAVLKTMRNRFLSKLSGIPIWTLDKKLKRISAQLQIDCE